MAVVRRASVGVLVLLGFLFPVGGSAGQVVHPVPAVQLYAVTQTVVANGTRTVVQNLTTAFSLGGMRVLTRNTVVVPDSGAYAVSASLCFEVGGGTVPPATYETQVYVTGAPALSWAVRTWSGWTPHHILPSQVAQPTGSSLLWLQAGQEVQLGAWQGAGQNVGVGWDAPSMGRTANYLSLSWVGPST